MPVVTRTSSSTSTNTKRPVRAVAMTIAVGAVSSLALSACSSSGTTGSGGKGGSPADLLAAGMTKVSDGKSASFEISIAPDAAAIAAINKSETDASAAAITSKLFSNGGIDLKVTVSADKPLKDFKSGDTDTPDEDVVLSAGGKDYLDLRTVKGSLYLKVDVPSMLALSGIPASAAQQELQNPQIPAALQPAIQAAMAGKWIGVTAADVKSLTQLAQTFGGSGDLNASPGGSVGQLDTAQLTTALAQALTKDSTVTDKGKGELEITGKVKTVGQDILAAIEPMLGSLPGSAKTSLDQAKESLNSIPDSQSITVDAWVSGGALTEIKIDLAQFGTAADTGGGHAPLDLKLSQSAPAVSVPSGVTNVDLQSVLSSLQGL